MVGQFVYQREGLTGAFFRKPPTDKVELRKVAGSYYLENKKYLINSSVFDKYYLKVHLEKKILSHIGPVYSLESYMLRKSDGEKLGKEVSIISKRGWLYGTNLLWTNNGDKCPKYKPEYLTNEGHTSLIQQIFYKL